VTQLFENSRRFGDSSSDKTSTYKELFSVTEEKKDSGWMVTKYDAFY